MVEGHAFRSCFRVYLGVRYIPIDLMSICVVSVVFYKKREARDIFGGGVLKIYETLCDLCLSSFPVVIKYACVICTKLKQVLQFKVILLCSGKGSHADDITMVECV